MFCKISVVIPLYNKEKTVERAIKSVLNQSYSAHEIIVVNDGSTDNSINILKTFSDKGIITLNQKNSGVSAARNSGISLATGDWVAFLDADDEWEKDFLNVIKDLIFQNPTAIVSGTAYCLGNDQNNKKFNIRLDDLKFNKGILQNYFVAASKSSPPLWSSAICIKKDMLEKIGGFPVGVKSGEDLITWARLACLGDIAYCSIPYATYWLDKSSMFESTPKRIPESNDYVGDNLKVLKKSFKGQKLKGISMYISQWHKMRASVYLRTGMNYLAMKEIIKSIYYHPMNWKIYIYSIILLYPKSFRNDLFKHFSSEINNN